MECKTVHFLLEDKDTKKRAFICNSREETFSSNINLSQHRSDAYHVHPSPFICNECSRIFRTKDNLFYHIRTHEAAKIFINTFDFSTYLNVCNLEHSLPSHKQQAVPKYEYSFGYHTSEHYACGYLR